jgi:tetratricopeptide (TPR) repeat protein
MIPDNKSSPICADLEADLSAYVDGELDHIDAKTMISHLDGCMHCQSFVEDLRQFARMHKNCFDNEAVLSALDGTEVFQNITSDLLIEKILKVADLFYKIGKAYMTKGLASNGRRTGKVKKVHHHWRTRPMAIAKARMKTGSLFREMNDLANASGVSMKQFTRAKTFFRAHQGVKIDHLEIGRRFMEECLSINPDRPEPRIFLGCYFFVMRNNEKAREQFRKVLGMTGICEEVRTEALLNLGQSLVAERRYSEAVECFGEVVRSGTIKRHPRYHLCLIFLAITYAKMGHYGKSITYFDRTVKDFPKHINEIKKKLWDLSSFQNILQTQVWFRKDLEHKFPALFAS